MPMNGQSNPVYQGNNRPMINTGQMGGNQLSAFQNQNQPKNYDNQGMFEGWGAGKYLMGPGNWLMEYFNPGMTNRLWDETGAGAAFDWLKKGLMGSEDEFQRIPNFDEEQMSALSQLLQHGLGNMNQFDFAPIEQQARSNFNQNTMPSIAERFTNLGGGNSLGSGSRQRMMAGAQAGLEENLAAMKQQYNLQREPLMQNYLRMGLAPRFDTNVKEHPGLLKSLGSGLGTAVGAAAKMLPMMI